MFIILDTLLLLVGVTMGVLALIMGIQSVRMLTTWDSATGHIVGFKREERCYLPRVEFRSRTGNAIVFTSRSGRGVRGYREGASVRVLFDPHEPSKAKIRSFFTLWLFPIVLGAFAALFIAGTLHQWGQ